MAETRKDHGGHEHGHDHKADSKGRRHKKGKGRHHIDPSIKPGSFKYIWASVSHNKGAIFGMTFLVLIIVLSLLSPIICRYPYSATDFTMMKAWPSLTHLFGTDDLGRDILSRILYGARYTLIIGILSTLVSAVLGILMGAIAGFFGGVVDSFLMRFLDIFQAFPSLVLAMAFCAVFGTGVDKCILALGITGIPGFARLMRANILRIRNTEYIEAATTINCPTWKIILQHIIPNAVSPVIVEIAMSISRNGLASSSLSFLGLGVQEPKPEWGAMLASTRNYVRDFPYMVIIPGIFIVLTVLSFNLLGDAFRDALDPNFKD
ncbi:MAG: ABC transporter permease [Blautia sp.]|nr:ABC transporter permease [Blautia sp.]